MLECDEKIRLISQRGDISSDVVLYDATLRNLQTLSESVSHFPDELKKRYDSIDWKAINGFRNILVHDYLGDIDPETVKGVIIEYLPELVRIVRIMLEKK